MNHWIVRLKYVSGGIQRIDFTTSFSVKFFESLPWFSFLKSPSFSMFQSPFSVFLLLCLLKVPFLGDRLLYSCPSSTLRKGDGDRNLVLSFMSTASAPVPFLVDAHPPPIRLMKSQIYMVDAFYLQILRQNIVHLYMASSFDCHYQSRRILCMVS